MGGSIHVDAYATSGPKGERPTGTVTINGVSRSVTCLKLDRTYWGARAVIGYGSQIIWFWRWWPGAMFAFPVAGDCTAAPPPGDSGADLNTQFVAVDSP